MPPLTDGGAERGRARVCKQRHRLRNKSQVLSATDVEDAANDKRPQQREQQPRGTNNQTIGRVQPQALLLPLLLLLLDDDAEQKHGAEAKARVQQSGKQQPQPRQQKQATRQAGKERASERPLRQRLPRSCVKTSLPSSLAATTRAGPSLATAAAAAVPASACP